MFSFSFFSLFTLMTFLMFLFHSDYIRVCLFVKLFFVNYLVSKRKRYKYEWTK